MKVDEFKGEMFKLAERFGIKYYPNEFLDVLWREVRDLSHAWFKKTVAIWLGQHRPALLPEFKEASKLEKEHIRYKKTSHVPQFRHDSIFTDKQTLFLFKLIKKIVNCEIEQKDEFLTIFLPALEESIANKQQDQVNTLFQEASKMTGVRYGGDDEH